MAQVNFNLPTIGAFNSTEDVDVLNALSSIKTQLNGGLDVTNMAPSSALLPSNMANVYGEVIAVLDTTIGTGDTTLGSTLTSLNAGIYLINAHWNLGCTGPGTSLITGKFFVGGFALPGQIPVILNGTTSGAGDRKQISNSWMVTLGSTVSVAMSAIKIDTGGPNAVTVFGSHSRFTYLKVA